VAEQGKRPVLVVVAGPNGSGKTSLTTKILQHQWMQGCHYINPDNIAQQSFGDWNSPSASLKAAEQAQREREQCLSERRSLAFETVLSAPDKVDFMQRAGKAGFFIRLFFVGTDSPSINASRVASRVMEGGHDVPIPKIISRYSKSIANCVAAITFVDRAYVYDNSRDLEDAKLLFRAKDGALFKSYGPVNEWAQTIVGVLHEPEKSTDCSRSMD
jgi:predicted ABC-type ATPase